MITVVADYKDLLIVISYYFIYNISILICFLVICRCATSNFRTMSDFQKFTKATFVNGCFIIVLLSMAGVPPFLGFFTKILIIKSIFNAGFGPFFILFLIITFISLFFYLQNIRFLLLPSSNAIDTLDNNEFGTATLLNTHFLIIGILILIFGGVYLNDLLLLACWLF